MKPSKLGNFFDMQMMVKISQGHNIEELPLYL